jgi:MFS family permease
MRFDHPAAQHFQLLKKPSYSFYFVGQLISMTGTFMQAVVQGWLVYRISGSSEWLGLIAFLTQFPAFLLSPIAGVVADQVDKRKLLIAMMSLSAVQALTLGLLTLQGQVTLWQIGALSVLLGFLNAFEMTARHSLSLDFVGRAFLPSAIALNALLINGSRIIGPLLAAALINQLGEGWCFLLNSASYSFVILSLLSSEIKSHKSQTSFQIWEPLRAGVQYVKSIKAFHFPLAFSALLGFIGSPYVVLLPLIAKDMLSGTAQTLGYLTAAHSVGALIGALFSVDLKPKTEIKPLLIQRLIGIGICHFLLGVSTNTWISAAALAGCGFYVIGAYPMINNFLQFKSDERMRGRVLSLYTMTFLATLPLGGLTGGFLADKISGSHTLYVIGAFSMIVGVGLILRYRKSTNF